MGLQELIAELEELDSMTPTEYKGKFEILAEEYEEMGDIIDAMLDRREETIDNLAELGWYEMGEWLDANWEMLDAKFAENGENRELDFDLEVANTREYDKYITNLLKMQKVINEEV